MNSRRIVINLFYRAYEFLRGSLFSLLKYCSPEIDSEAIQLNCSNS